MIFWQPWILILNVMANLTSGCQMMKDKQTNSLTSASVTAKKHNISYWNVDFWRYQDSTWQSQYEWHIFMPQLYMKYAGPGRSARRGGPLWIQMSNQTTGRPQQDSSVGCQGNMSRNFQPWQRNCRGRWGEWKTTGNMGEKKRPQFTGTKLEKQWTHAEYVLARQQRRESLENVWDVQADEELSCLPQLAN